MRFGRRFGRNCVVAAALGLAASVVPAAPAAAAQVSRIAGADRYATAASVATLFGSGVPIVVVATGENFPDALAAGPAGARGGGPVLLTRGTDVPESTAAALEQLDPANIVVLGGAGVISDGVVAQLQQYTAGSVVRVAGQDRFETAAAVAANFPVGVPLVYVANGLDFPDALAGGATAGSFDSPLLLVHPNGIPASTAAQLERLDPGLIVIAGGASAVSEDVESQLFAYSDEVLRESGTNRFETAVDISFNTFDPGTRSVFLATGRNFPDALAGGPLAGTLIGPLLLSERDCVPQVVLNEINRLGPEQVVLLGGEGALSNSVAALVACPGGGLPTTG